MTTKKTTARKLVKRSESMFPAWRRQMNDEQLEAILHDGGPLRLLAAAGSGKTRVVTHRIARLVTEGGVDPTRILAVTFSKKAADEMNKRVYDLDVHGARVGTWHSFCLQILREDRVELNANATPFADWDIPNSEPRHLLKQVVGYKVMDWSGVDVNKLASFIARCNANLFAPDSDGARELARESGFYGINEKRACEAFQRYNDKLEEKEILTFDNMLVYVARHLADETNRAAWAARYDQVIQDEGQDENRAQKHIAHLLAQDHRNYMIVGDVFQSIYAFRGSKPDYLAQFDREWPDAKTIWLGTNYRSGRKIIDVANGIVAKAKVEGYEPRMMVAGRDFDGEARAVVSEDFDDEANNFVARIVAMVQTGDATYEDFTALFRTNAQSRALEEALLAARIPYVVVGGTSFYERKEVRDILAYLRIGAGRGELDDVKRCINAPFRFLGAKFVERVTDLVDRMLDDGTEATDISWTNVIRKVSDGERIQGRQRQSAEQWAQLVARIAQRIERADEPEATQEEKREARPAVILEDIIRETRYLEWITKEEGEESLETSGAANVRELVRVAERFADCDELLDYIEKTIKAARKQREDKQAGGDRVLLMSVHRSKGLEWPHVWVAGFNEMVMPHVKGDIEEERRLAYVACTRARDSLVLSYVRTMATRAGIRDASPSRFLADSGVRPDAPRGVDDDAVDEAHASEEAAACDAGFVVPQS